MNTKFILFDKHIKVDICGDHKAVTKVTLANAFLQISDFIKEHHLDVQIKKTAIKKVIVYHYHHRFIKDVIKALKVDDHYVLPKTLSGVVIDHTLYILSKSEYENVFPEEGQLEHGYVKLFVHELAHLLHIDLLEGKEDLMGPRWFYEGFATYVAKQFLDQKHDQKTLLDIFENDKGTRYTFYADIFRRIIEHKTVNELIFHINDDGYIENLKKYI